MSSESRTPILLLDGGLGSTLEDEYHYEFNDGTPLWSGQLLVTQPGLLLEAHTGFAKAGADVILTATYQVSYEGFSKSGVTEEDARQVARGAVKMAKRAFEGREGKVALSLGPYGATMLPPQEYGGKYDAYHRTVSQLREWHVRRIGMFCGPDREVDWDDARRCWEDVDFVAFETIPLAVEILAVRETMFIASKEREEGRGKEKDFWISCVFPGEGNQLPDGSDVRAVVGAMLGERQNARRPMGIGINCTKIGKIEWLIEEFESAVKEIVESGEVKEWPSLVVYPDKTNGQVYNTTTHKWEKAEADGTSSVSAGLRGILCFDSYTVILTLR
jgi:homocysteine S-methyltransferase